MAKKTRTRRAVPAAPAPRRSTPRRPPPRAPATKPAAMPLDGGLTIVGIGASAGGLEAFTQLLEALDAEAGITLVLVQHLSPHHESALTTLLAPHTTMPVIEATEGVRLQPNHVYVIPPNTQMVLDGDALHLTPRPGDRTAHTPIDSFLASLAAAAGDRAIAVVLSGTASDGAVGIRDVKAAGGITFAQTPQSAKFDGMPKAAIATGMIDVVLTPAEIGNELSQIAHHPFGRRVPGGEAAPSDDQLQRVFELLHPVSGVDFRHYKLPTVRRRVLRRMALHRINEMGAYIELLESDPDEVRGLFQDLLIHVTRFFREPESFDTLVAEVFPRLIDGRDPARPIRVWVCGCATGEEAYSLAIALLEFMQARSSGVRIQIFATDVSEAAVEHARSGLYQASIAPDVGPERLRRFFTRSDGHYRVSKQIRDVCVFARQDLTRDPPFSRLDLVMCRNVLIYMNAVLQRRLISMFHYALVPDGHLMLGQAESIGAQASLFTLIDKRARLYRKKAEFGMAHRYADTAQAIVAMPAKRIAAGSVDPERNLQVEVNRLILDRYAPAGVVVDAELQIVQVRGQTGAFLEPAEGRASLSLLRMLREGLLYGVRSAFHAARKSKRPAHRADLRVRSVGGWRNVDVEVVPLTEAGRQYYLVLFDQARPRRRGEKPRARKTGGKTTSMAQLQRELESSREYMQAIIQELEAANEELQSANEEILSSNEELQSTNEELDTAKEELQSTNEELNTVNEELQARNDELSRVNSDLLNLVGSVQIAIVIVGGDLRIRRFTPMAEKMLNLIPADLDRSIAQINPNIDCPNLAELIIECIDSVSVIEREVRDRQGRWLALRLRPYKSLDNKIDGAVLALFDIDILKRSEQNSQRAQLFTEGVVEGVSQPIAIVDGELRIARANHAFAQVTGQPMADIVGRPLNDFNAFAAAAQTWRIRARTAEAGAVLPDVRVGGDGSGGALTFSARSVPAPDALNGSVLIVSGRRESAPDTT